MKSDDIKNIYGVYEDIKLTDDGFRKSLAERRARHYCADVSLLAGEVKKIDINNLTDVPNGKIRIDIEGARFECFYHEGKQKKLYIILSGARTAGGQVVPVPFYNGWSWYPNADFYWLSVEDPMYFKYDDLTLGWFYGDEEHNYREYLALIAEKFAKRFGIDKDDVVFYGRSGGGTAAIHAAAIFGGAAVCINGQLNFEFEYSGIDKFKEVTGIDLHESDPFHRNDMCYLMQTCKKAKYIIIVNCKSEWDYGEHLLYMCRRLGITPSYGIEQNGNVFTWLYEANGARPHVSFEDKNLFFAINFLTELAVKNAEIEAYKPLYQLFGEFWYDKYETEINAAKKSRLFAPTGITEINGKLLNTENFDGVEVIENINFEAKDDGYYCYYYGELKLNFAYRFRIEGVKIEPQTDCYTVGVFDKKSKKFLEVRDFAATDDADYSFIVNGGDQRLMFCIFAGRQGATACGKLHVDKLTVYYSEI